MVIVSIFFILPTFVEIKNNSLISNKEVENKSKSNLEKVLKGEPLDKSSEVDEGLVFKEFI